MKSDTETVNEVLRRLVGPNGPRVTCEECFMLLNRYVDLKLAGYDVDALMPGMCNHLEDCLSCFEGYSGLAAIVRMLDEEEAQTQQRRSATSGEHGGPPSAAGRTDAAASMHDGVLDG